MVGLYGGDPIGSAALTEQGTYAVPSTSRRTGAPPLAKGWPQT
jgi:hypothetical protein